MHPKQVLLQRADEPFGAAVAFRGADEGGRAFDAEESEFLLEVVRHVLRSVIVPHREATCDIGRKAAEVSPHALADRFQRLEAGGSRMGVNADALGGTMIHRDEYRRRPFTGEGGGKRPRMWG